MSAAPDCGEKEPPLLTYTIFPDLFPTTKSEHADIAWAEFVADLRSAAVRSDKEHCRLISMCEYGDELSKSEKQPILRHAANVRRAYGAEFDYDGAPADDGKPIPPETAAERLRAAGIMAAVYTTPSHQPHAPRWRALLPFSEPTVPEKRAEYLARANRVLGGIATSESFTLSQSFYIGRVKGAEYTVLETHGRAIDLAADIEPLYHVSRNNKGESTRDETTDDELRAAFARGEDRYQTMLKLSSRWAARGMAVDDIAAALTAMLETCPNGTHNGDGIDLRSRVRPLAGSAVRKFGESRRDTDSEEASARAQQPQTWAPPAVTSYGESFDPAAIPLRQWLIRGRYALGEGTAIAGPPGTNKSTLLLTDAVQLATGRSLLGDAIDQCGGVLFLVGEDRRRDFEARLAGVCEHYRIHPRELGNRLHVVYQSEINPADYTLGEMIDDMATLNTHMFEWLRAFPDLVALFIDPMLSWHRLIENENAAMQLLCVGLRGLATQGNIAVAFDHHVTKVSMYDLEAHVGNLAAMRGASSIAADMRWAYTMAKLKAETAQQFGIPEPERRIYRRLDTLKASYGPDDDAPRLLKIESVRIANGEHVGVLTGVDGERLQAAWQERTEEASQQWRDRLSAALARMLREKAPRSASEAALWIATREPTLYIDNKKNTPLSDRSVYRRLPVDIGEGLDTVSNGRPARIVLRVSGNGNGARREIGFEQGEMG